MTSNTQFLDVIKKSFAAYLSAGTSRSTAKLKPLHGQIAGDIDEAFGFAYTVKAQGYKDGKEEDVRGKYYSKKVDITVLGREGPVAGYGVKFIMRNYSANSNNYFENMLGETANLRARRLSYFQIIIMFDKVPHFRAGGEFTGYDRLTENNLSKYESLSEDNPGLNPQVPSLTCLCIVTLKEKSPGHSFKDEKEYMECYRGMLGDPGLITYSKNVTASFRDQVVLNDYESFIM
ncbi:MAG: hypothetical protein LUD29_01535 [Clostridia bacterium]|nr:hypothetical protein [Clostridia bacterium]